VALQPQADYTQAPNAATRVWAPSPSPLPTGALSVTANSATNQITTTGYQYDSAGNMTQEAGLLYTYTYDAEDHLTQASGMTGGPWNYVYDGNGLRVEKSNSATNGTLYWRSITGDAIAESNLSGTITNEYVFFAGRRIAQDASSGVYFYYADQTGSTTVMTNASGTPCYQATFTPYGEEHATQTTCQQNNYKFTGFERDAETGLDYAFARYYDSRLGRFLSADPFGGDISNPQSLNRYAYVANDPADFVDPSGQKVYRGPISVAGEAAFAGLDFLVLWGVYGENGDWFLGFYFNPFFNGLDRGSSGPGTNAAPSCSFNVLVGPNPFLSGTNQQNFQQAFVNELNRIFGDAGVGINLVTSSGDADFVVSLEGAMTGRGGSTNVIGQAFGPNSAVVYLGNLLTYNPNATAGQLGTAAGEVAAHEIGHDLYPGQDHPGNVDPSNIMKEGGDPFDDRLWFARGNEVDIKAKCLKNHRNP
jgi:RHS repeat-associated protein